MTDKGETEKTKKCSEFCRKPAFWGHTGHTCKGMVEGNTHVFLKVELSIKNPHAE
ncbi:hypothetical protein [Methanosarcina sp. WWM596]|uniref:hypothetical protein n=1 Tax=Methanosarcina sp. WWM596 TaxID=1434103 RepID=UPI0012DFF00B|nr:hypothetical protein [Methanosarcina sp. WWM596]